MKTYSSPFYLRTTLPYAGVGAEAKLHAVLNLVLRCSCELDAMAARGRRNEDVRDGVGTMAALSGTKPQPSGRRSLIGIQLLKRILQAVISRKERSIKWA